MVTPREIPIAGARWTRPGLSRPAARLAAAGAALALLVLFVEALCWALQIPLASEALTSAPRVLFLMAALSALASAALGAVAWPRLRSGAARVEDGALQILGAKRVRRIPVRAIRDGLVSLSGRGASLALQLNGGARVDLAMGSEEEAQVALEALGLGPERRRTEVTLGSANRPLLVGCAGIFLGPLLVIWSWAFLPGPWLDSRLFLPLMCVLSIALMLVLARSVAPKRITIGTDGILVDRPFRRRFIPYARIQFVRVLGAEIHLGISPPERPSGSTGESRVLSIMGDRADVVMSVHWRIQALRTLAASREEGAAMDALNPRGKGVEAWISSLVALMTKNADTYRHRAIPVESLLEILARPDADVGPRIGAAIALKASGHAGAAEHIRAASESAASDKVRAALERIAAEEEADRLAIEEALLESGVLDGEGQARREALPWLDAPPRPARRKP